MLLFLSVERFERELDTLERVSQILGDGLELSEVFQRAMTLLGEYLHIQRAALILVDRSKDQFRVVAGYGISPEAQERGRYAIGEGVTGKVIETGQSAILEDVSQSPEFLNRMGDRSIENTQSNGQPISFICIPLRDGDEIVGAISVDKPLESQDQLFADARVLRIVANAMAQTIRIHHLVQLEKDQWLAETEQLRHSLHSKYRFDNIIGSSPAMLDVLSTIAQVATSRATVLLLGETGVGKELIAKAIHYNSPRKDRPLIRVNCGALSPQLLESELFGHVKGAFTGAVRDKVGRFEAADNGTIFLDEIGTLDSQLQVKLLRVLQEREFERVGDHHTTRVDVRVIAATNLDLEEEVRKGTFREDLYYRLNVVTINLPPLRSRREDIPRLIDHFLDRYNKENARSLRKISRDVLNTMLRYPWPGNVRELENAIERAVVLSAGEEFTEDLLPLQIRMFGQQVRGDAREESIEAIASRLAQLAVKKLSVEEGKIYDIVIGETERQLIREAMSYCGNVKVRTADYLGINRNTLNKKVRELEVDGVD